MLIELCCGQRSLELNRARIMGVLNVTPDSFSDGGRFDTADRALEHAARMISAGAEFIDVGGESTRPGAEPVSADVELQRVLPVIEQIKKHYPDTIISIDTSKPEVMSQAVEAGALLINDVNALRSEQALEVASRNKVAICLMHMQGKPRSMQHNPHYDDVVVEVKQFLSARVAECVQAGIDANRLLIDPGFGFGKSMQHNLQLLARLGELKSINRPILVGMSRKSLLGQLLNKAVDERLSGSLALACLARYLGAAILRVHDVAETRDVLTVCDAVLQHRTEDSGF